jgi:hypothetical protein
MNEFKIEAVGDKRVKKHPMPSAEKVAETLETLWSICWDKQRDWTRPTNMNLPIEIPEGKRAEFHQIVTKFQNDLMEV